MRSHDTWLQRFAAGAGAGALVKTGVAPLDRAKVLLQLQGMSSDPKRYAGIVRTLRAVVRADGVRGLWAGNGANVVRVIPVHGLKLSGNDVFRDLIAPGVAHPKTWQLLAAGSLAGAFQLTVTLPLEVIRTRLTVGARLDLPRQYRGIVHCGVHTVRAEGAAALYKGLAPTLASGVPFVALQMTLFDELSRRLPRDADGSRSVLWMLPAGACAGVVAQTLTYPGDTVRKLMMIDGAAGAPRAYSSVMDCCRQVARRHGWRGFFHGVGPNTVRAVPEAALQLAVYETFKRALGLQTH